MTTLQVLAAVTYASLPLKRNVLNTPAEVASQTTPLAKSLALSLPDGKTHIGGSTSAMMKAVALLSPASGLLGNRGGFEASQVDSWVQFGWTALEVPLAASKQSISASSSNISATNIPADFFSATYQLDHHLKSNAYIVGHSVTNADIAICCALHEAVSNKVWDPRSSEMKDVVRWYNGIVNQEFFSLALLILNSAT